MGLGKTFTNSIVREITHWYLYPNSMTPYPRMTRRLDVSFEEREELKKAIEVLQNEWECTSCFTWHLENIYIDTIWLFIPVTIVFLILVWFFNDKIKAR